MTRLEKITHQGDIIEVVQKEVEVGGKMKTFEYARRAPGVRLIVAHEGRVLLTKEYRRELDAYDYRLPGGKVFDSLNEYNLAIDQRKDMVVCAKAAAIKEAKEEIGIDILDVEFFHKSICGATVVWDLYYFVIGRFTQNVQHLD